ncbi:hypothetical protein O9992_00830 [Vibrio lentus]|nr:hypothetical protein [Vibrio lentus]
MTTFNYLPSIFSIWAVPLSLKQFSITGQSTCWNPTATLLRKDSNNNARKAALLACVLR